MKKENSWAFAGWMLIGAVIGSLIAFPAGTGVGCSGAALDRWCDAKTVYVNQTIEIEKQYALITGSVQSWGENVRDSTELLFSGWIYNYGGLEGKNITVTCKVSENDIVKRVISGNVGNVASYSYKAFELRMDNFIHNVDGSTALCYVSDCDNCTILDRQIPQLWNSFIGDEYDVYK